MVCWQLYSPVAAGAADEDGDAEHEGRHRHGRDGEPLEVGVHQVQGRVLLPQSGQPRLHISQHQVWSWSEMSNWFNRSTQQISLKILTVESDRWGVKVTSQELINFPIIYEGKDAENP